MLNSDTLIDFDVIEILLITTIAFIGAFVHRFWEFIYDQRPITFKTWIAIFTNVLIVTIISLAISPMVRVAHPRFILIPPLLMGLAGEELIHKLIHIDSSTKLLDWFLRLFKLRDTPLENPPERDDKLEKVKDNHKELLEKIIRIDNKIEEALQEYAHTSDPSVLLNCYREAIYDISIIEIDYNKWHNVLDDVVISHYEDMIESYNLLTSLKNKYNEKIKNDIEKKDM